MSTMDGDFATMMDCGALVDGDEDQVLLASSGASPSGGGTSGNGPSSSGDRDAGRSVSEVGETQSSCLSSNAETATSDRNDSFATISLSRHFASAFSCSAASLTFS